MIANLSCVGVSKKTKKLSKPRKKIKNNRLIFLLKVSVRFGFQNLNQQNPNRTEPARFKGYYKYEKKNTF